MNTRVQHILFSQFGLDTQKLEISPFGSGLINRTWLVEDLKGRRLYIVQKINDRVFKNPPDIGFNIRLIADHLKENYPGYLFTTPVPGATGEDMVWIDEDGWYRMFHYIEGAHTIDIASSAGQAYEAARQFGLFTKYNAGLDPRLLKVTIPQFHDLGTRYRLFLQAIVDGNPERLDIAREEISWLLLQEALVVLYEKRIAENIYKSRVTHHDTKISNVLFDKHDKGICVIDLDTVMPGFFFSDFGDMMRTYLSPVSEEETDYAKIDIRANYFEGIAQGYLSAMADELSKEERNDLIVAGKLMTYMQSLRFMTDYLEDDKYYGQRYEGHNFIRAKNQIILLQRLMDSEAGLETILKQF